MHGHRWQAAWREMGRDWGRLHGPVNSRGKEGLVHLFLHCVPKQAILSCICEWAQAVAHRQDVGKAGWVRGWGGIATFFGTLE